MRKRITATIITIGDELLIGQVVDTNSAYMSRELNKAGIIVERRIAVGDKASEIIRVLDDETERVDLILITGGLGPTSDDITKQTLAKYFNTQLVMDAPTLKNIKLLYKNVYKKEPTAVNLKQALVPEGCEVLVNKRGTAPCMIFQKKKSHIISMAGVPFEMEGVMADLIPWLKLHFQLPKVLHQTVVTTGIGESDLAAVLKSFEKKLPSFVNLAYLPGPAGLRLRLTSTVFDRDTEAEVRKQFNTLKKQVRPYLAMADDMAPEVVLGKLLKKLKSSVSTAESCTGGRIAGMITSVSGSSEYYPGSIISYSNAVKEKQLGVKAATLKQHGAVSEQVVQEMLRGVIKKMHTDYGIAVSGIMGPGGGSAQKPVGTVWIAIGTLKKITTKKVRFRFDRKRNIEATAAHALYMLKNFIEENVGSSGK